MKLIIGLGNPGLKYRNTKHNIGFRVVEAIAKESNIKINKELHASLLGRGSISGQDVTLALPQTYMNLSGHAVGELYKSEIRNIEDIIVICDDVYLKLGRIRLRKRGSSGGHKGIESIRDVLGSDDFARLRVGIATDLHKGNITNYVLSAFKRRDLKNVSHAVSLAKDAIIYLMANGVEKTMSLFNKRKAGTS